MKPPVSFQETGGSGFDPDSCFKAISKNEYIQIAQDFCSFSRRKKGRIASYETLHNAENGQKDQQVGCILRRKSTNSPLSLT